MYPVDYYVAVIITERIPRGVIGAGVNWAEKGVYGHNIYRNVLTFNKKPEDCESVIRSFKFVSNQLQKCFWAYKHIII